MKKGIELKKQQALRLVEYLNALLASEKTGFTYVELADETGFYLTQIREDFKKIGINGYKKLPRTTACETLTLHISKNMAYEEVVYVVVDARDYTFCEVFTGENRANMYADRLNEKFFKRRFIVQPRKSRFL